MLRSSTLVRMSPLEIGSQSFHQPFHPTSKGASQTTEGASRAPRRYPLAGTVICGRCGSKMVGGRRDHGARRYFCAKGVGRRGCDKATSTSEPFEEIIAEAVLCELDSPALQRTLASVAAPDDRAEALRAEIDRTHADSDGLGQGIETHSVCGWGDQETQPSRFSPSQLARLANQSRGISTPVRLPQPSSRLLPRGNSPHMSRLSHLIVTMLSTQWPNGTTMGERFTSPWTSIDDVGS